MTTFNAKLQQKLALLAPHDRVRLLSKVGVPSTARSGASSFQQRYFWTLNEVLPQKSALNCRLVLRLRGRLDLEIFTNSLHELIARHDIYRTIYKPGDGQLEPVVEPNVRIPLTIVDRVSESPTSSESNARLDAFLDEEFDLQTHCPLRVIICRHAPEDHTVGFCFHHIASDGEGWNLFWNDFRELYLATLANRGLPPVSPDIQYSAYAARQAGRKAIRDDALRYWVTKLQNLPDPPQPRDEKVRDHTPACSEVFIDVDDALWRVVQSAAGETQTTLHTVFFSAFFAWHFKYFSATDLAIGTPINTRFLSGDRGVHGCTINMLPVRVQLDGSLSFRNLLTRVAACMREAFDHGEFDLLELIETCASQLRRTAPLFRSAFQTRNIIDRFRPLDDSGSVERITRPRRAAQLPLLLEVHPDESGRRVGLTYDKRQTSRHSAEQMVTCFRSLLENLVKHPDTRIASVQMLDDRTLHVLTDHWARNTSTYPRNETIATRFRAIVEEHAERIALVAGEHLWTYRQLFETSLSLAGNLRARGIRSGQHVGICMERSPEMIHAMLAVVECGATYVPLDPGYSMSRLGFMTEDAETAAVLTDKTRFSRLRNNGINAWLVEDMRMPAMPSDPEPVPATAPACLMYTSGTTGSPKGSLIPHRGVIRLVNGADYAALDSEQCFLQLASPSFDAATFEIWAPLLNGGKLVLMPPGVPSFSDIGEAIERHGVTTLWLTAALFHAVVDDAPEILRPLRQLLAGGDTLSPPRVARIRELCPNVKLINGYGPTENTTFSCCHTIPDSWEPSESVPIGRPIANSEAYILNVSRQPVPIGVVGELYLGGDGLSSGYWKRPDLNAIKFIKHPFSSEPGARLFQTGDLARYLPDGNIQFLGRADHQVKIRGFRVELGEIETILMQHPDVRESVVNACQDVAGDARLVAYVVPRSNAGWEEEPLRYALRAKLPDYMVPVAFVRLDKLPLTPNGKVDRKALPIPESSQWADDSIFVPPRTSVEERLAAILRELLQVSRVGAHDDFVALGGHSLVAMRIVSRVRKDFGFELPLRSLFEASSVAQLAKLIDQFQKRQHPAGTAAGDATVEEFEI